MTAWKRILLALLVAAAPFGTAAAAAAAPAASTQVVTADIENFWIAHDAIRREADPARKQRLIQSLYIDRGTPGLHALMQARGYTAEQYVAAIDAWPRYWASVRPLTHRAFAATTGLEADLASLKRLYPALRPASITYAIGVLRTGGTTLDDNVLIGAELALGDDSVDVSELPESLQTRLRTFYASQPFHNNGQNNIHEFIHTQQIEAGDTLAQYALREGVAELVAELIAGKKPDLPLYVYGPAHEAELKRQFQADRRGNNYRDWLYNSSANRFGVSDLGYYVGYRIASAYYAAQPDKAKAVATLIELRYDDVAMVEALIDRSGYFR
ncbi:hypothetical protein [Stenotrophomonas sp. TWI587]|uniref:hypothetical protein n=1 Tax=Stenotrophomonas sp. TWI587 TaxID=3136783 RepID=UPI00320A7B12